MTTKIIAAENEENWQTFLKTVLKLPKFDLRLVQTPEEFKECLRDAEFDLAIVNMNLQENPPDVPKDELGFEILEHLQKNYRTLPRIVMTGDPGARIVSRFVEPFDVKEVLVKSQFKRTDLMEAIENALRSRSRKKQAGQRVSTRVIPEEGEATAPYQAFFAYHAEDRGQVGEIADAMRQRGFSVWFETERIAPERWGSEVIHAAGFRAKTAAIFISATGLGNWDAFDVHAFMKQCATSGLPLIPVFLPGVAALPEQLIFLKAYHGVHFATLRDADALNRLEWGITGTRPPALQSEA